MRDLSEWSGLELLDLYRAQVGEPAVEAEKRIVTAIYYMLKDGTMYNDLGSDHLVRHSTDQQKNRLVKRLTDLGYTVEIKPIAA